MKEKFIKVLLEYYKPSMARHIMSGLKNPSYKVMLKLEREHGITPDVLEKARS